jgi:hypothetical protein
MSPVYMQLGEPTPARLELALSLVLAGRGVDSGGFSLAVADGVLRVDVDYSWTKRNDSFAMADVRYARSRLDNLLAENEKYRNVLGGLPCRFALVYSYGMGDVEVGEIVGDAVKWRI